MGLNKKATEMQTKNRNFERPDTPPNKGPSRLKFRFPGIGSAFLSTGLPDLDKMIGGQPKSSLIVLAGDRVSHRTKLAAKIARHVAANDNTPVLFCPLDPDAGACAAQFIGDVVDMPLFFGPAGETSIAKFFTFIKQVRRQWKIGLIIIDHLGKLNADSNFDSREDEIAWISYELKQLVWELGIHIIALVNLEDGPPPTRSPFVSDLGIYDVLGQDADLVLFATSEKLFITKNRYGPEGDISLRLAPSSDQGRAS
jgi:replicative DNA helicase